jgi:hypothetical protein
MKVAAIENQWVFVAVFKAQHTTDDDLVITTVVTHLSATLKACGILRKYRCPVQAFTAFDAIKLIGAPAGETR